MHNYQLHGVGPSSGKLERFSLRMKLTRLTHAGGRWWVRNLLRGWLTTTLLPRPANRSVGSRLTLGRWRYPGTPWAFLVQNRADQAPRSVAQRRPRRTGHRRVGRLVQPSAPLSVLRRHAADRDGGRPLRSTTRQATRRAVTPISLRTRRDGSAWLRGHWHIENRVHCVRDVTCRRGSVPGPHRRPSASDGHLAKHNDRSVTHKRPSQTSPTVFAATAPTCTNDP